MARRFAFGNYGSGFIGRASRAGFDAAYVSDPESLSFDMAWAEITQIVKTGVATPSGSWIAHSIGRVRLLANFDDMGFVPHVLVWAPSLENLQPNACMVTSSAVYVGYNRGALAANSDSYFASLQSVPMRYIVTKVAIDVQA